MVKLKTKSETVHKVSLRDLESFLKEITGHDYECLANEEWGNDSQHRFCVRGVLGKYETAYWKEFKKHGTQKQFHLHAILEGLCADRKIESGTYLIEVSW